jgi:hypothetical protein
MHRAGLSGNCLRQSLRNTNALQLHRRALNQDYVVDCTTAFHGARMRGHEEVVKFMRENQAAIQIGMIKSRLHSCTFEKREFEIQADQKVYIS